MTTPSRLERIAAASGPLHDFVNRYYTASRGRPDVCDFAFGNPHEMPLPGLVDALKRWAVPQDQDWFAYKHSEPSAREVVAASLREWRNLDFEPEDIAITIGGFGALAVAILTLIEPGDEVIYSLPPWFFYEPLVLAMGGEPVKVKARASDFDLDLVLRFQRLFPTVELFDDGTGGSRPDEELGVGVVVFEIIVDRPLGVDDGVEGCKSPSVALARLR